MDELRKRRKKMEKIEFLTEGQKERIQYARKFFAWANRPAKFWEDGREVALPPMTDEDIWGVLERCSRWRLNPADNNQVQVWRDKSGSVLVEPAYQVIINWLDSFGPHSAIKYARLVGDAAKDEGSIDQNDLIYSASIVFYDEVSSAIRAGIDASTAVALATHRGVGRVAARDFITSDGKEKPYSAPNGRTPADKAKKRAVIDLASDMGTPTDSEYQALASLNRAVTVLPSDLAGTDALSWNDARALATARAEERQLPPPPAEVVSEAIDALYGTEEDVTPTQSPTDGDQVSQGAFKSPGEAIAWGMASGVFESEDSAIRAYDALKAERKPKSAEEMGKLWRAEIARLRAEESDQIA